MIRFDDEKQVHAKLISENLTYEGKPLSNWHNMDRGMGDFKMVNAGDGGDLIELDYECSPAIVRAI